MPFSAIIPVSETTAANYALNASGYGTRNFTVPLVGDNQAEITHYGLNCAADAPEFLEAVSRIPNVSVLETTADTTTFDEHAASLGLAIYQEQEVTNG
jgi:hypothetical protein